MKKQLAGQHAPEYMQRAFDTEGAYRVYCDGAAGSTKTIPRRGGWGVAVFLGGACIYRECGFSTEGKITANAMELEGLIRSLYWAWNALPQRPVEIWTDSQWTAGQVAQLGKLRARGWPGPHGERLKLIYELLYEMDLTEVVMLRWLKGHNRNPGNDLADKLAAEGAYEGARYQKKQ
jgi:ribonuclease HI